MAGRVKPTPAEIGARVALVVASIVVSLAALELGCRIARDPSLLWHWPNEAAQRVNAELGLTCTNIYDAGLGWRPGRNVSLPGFHTGPDGFRTIPAEPPQAGPPLLVMGSSFAVGTEVADEETWPAYLQRALARPVIDAGVIGYALDQTVLYAEEIVPRLKPAALVVSFTPMDIDNLEMKKPWAAQKPYFVPSDAGGEPELRNVPVPREASLCGMPFWSGLLGWSVLADIVVDRLRLWEEWYYDEQRATPPGTGEILACPLMTRLARLGVPALVVAQPNRAVWGKPEILAKARHHVAVTLGCARAAGLATLDMMPIVEKEIAARGLDALYRVDHHTPAGNRLTADEIARVLERR